MSKICIVTNKKTISGNKISHSNIKKKRKFKPNIMTQKIWFEEKKKYIKLKLSSKGLKIINKIGLEKSIKKYNLKTK
jgi:large subunit ribosomal protein L28